VPSCIDGVCIPRNAADPKAGLGRVRDQGSRQSRYEKIDVEIAHSDDVSTFDALRIEVLPSGRDIAELAQCGRQGLAQAFGQGRRQHTVAEPDENLVAIMLPEPLQGVADRGLSQAKPARCLGDAVCGEQNIKNDQMVGRERHMK
jgi:hypothetical protein